jgi:glycerophosphoryl diester phosphodiesterase
MQKKILCHRGVSRDKDNTLSNICAINNLDDNDFGIGVEFDVQFTKDLIFVCHHDEYYNNKRIADINYCVLKNKLGGDFEEIDNQIKGGDFEEIDNQIKGGDFEEIDKQTY